MRAVYRDEKGARFSCPVEKRDDKWMMLTSDGLLTDITYHFQDDAAGALTFSHYREDPKPQDSRLHINRMPGESSFGALQRAYAEKEIVEQRKHRLAARQEMQDVPADPVEVANARAANNYAAAVKRPRGGGVGLIVKE